MATVTVYDSAGGGWPEDSEYILAYCDAWGNGQYATNVEWAKAVRPHARIIQVAVQPPATGVVVAGYDVEPGALSIAQAAGLINHDVVKLNRRPFAYLALETSGYSVAEFEVYVDKNYTQIVGKYDIWLADPNGVADVPAGYIGHQYSWPNACPVVTDQQYDVSVLLTTAACLKVGDPQ